MSSSAGKAGVPYSGTYTGSKHALHVRNHTIIFFVKSCAYLLLGLFWITENRKNGNWYINYNALSWTNIFQLISSGSHRKAWRGIFKKKTFMVKLIWRIFFSRPSIKVWDQLIKGWRVKDVHFYPLLLLLINWRKLGFVFSLSCPLCTSVNICQQSEKGS